MGRDDFGYYRVRIEDELRDGEEEDIITQVRLCTVILLCMVLSDFFFSWEIKMYFRRASV